MYSCLSHLECPRCGATLPADRVQGLCDCGSPLLARYDLEAVAGAWTPRRSSERDRPTCGATTSCCRSAPRITSSPSEKE